MAEIGTASVISVELTVTRGESAGRSFMIGRFPSTIGRGQDSDIVLADSAEHPTLSRCHVVLEMSSGQVLLRDRSANGTWVGSHQLGRGESHEVRNEGRRADDSR